MMKFSREKSIGLIIVLALVLAVGTGVYMYRNQDPYEGFVTHIDVQGDEGVRTLAQQRIATAQASIQAAKDAGQTVDADLYGTIAGDALILGDLVLARESLEASLASNSLNSGTWSSYGYTLLMMHDYENAKTAYLRAVELTPMEQTYRDAINILQDFFPEEKNKVKELYEDSVDTLGQKNFNMIGLGNWYADAGDCSKAKDHFEVAESLAGSEEIREQIEEEKLAALTACKALDDTGENTEERELNTNNASE
jgi:tetratricopeptide (TPR) repeat protein